MPTSSASARIAEWIVTTERKTIPSAALAVAGRACLDCVGAMVAGAADPLGRKIFDYVRAQGGLGSSSLVGTRHQTTASLAALANGTAAHALEYDDTTGFGHSSAVIVPALLASAESAAGVVSGVDVMSAYVVGLEVGIGFFRGG